MTMFIFDLGQIQHHHAQPIVLAFRLSQVLGCLRECPSIQFQRASARRVLLSSLALLPALRTQNVIAQQTTRGGDSSFSFGVYGDSRSMMYLPYKSDQRDEAVKLMVDMFELVLPEKVSEEVVRRDVRLTYDPATDELVQIVMPFETKSEVTTLKLDKGWVTEASVEDVKLLPGVHRTMSGFMAASGSPARS